MAEGHTTIYFKDMKPLMLCGKVMGFEGKASIYQAPFMVRPTLGEHDFNKCENCKKNLESITKSLTNHFNGLGSKEKFPYCCELHANLQNIKEFDLVYFICVPQMTAEKIIFTHQHIINNYKNPNWEKEICDYIDYVIESFGQMPNDCGAPLFLSTYFEEVIYFLNNQKDMPRKKKTTILNYLKSFEIQKAESTDLNTLIETYERWLKVFPFELNTYFGAIKDRLEKQLPFLNKLDKNIYSGTTKASIHSKSTLFDSLVDLTDKLLIQIDGAILLEKGLVSDTNKIQVDLLIQERKQERKQGYQTTTENEEEKYNTIIKTWLTSEQAFWKKMEPLIVNQTLNSNIDWIKVFEELDIEKDISIQTHITNTTEQKKNYFSKASYNLTLQYLLNFKKETFFFSDERKREWIKALDIKAPNIARTGNALLNQTVFEAQSNYFDFINIYSGILTSIPINVNKTSSEDRLSLSQIALIHAYEGKDILKGDKAKEIAATYGYVSTNSGESLYQDYIKCKKTVDRKGGEDTKKKTQNKVERIKSILPNLSEVSKNKANDEIAILETIIKNWVEN